MLGRRAIGLVQLYLWREHPAEAGAVDARSDEIGVDFLLGEPDLVGRGVGRAMLAAFLENVAPARPVRVDVDTDNRRSLRCLKNLGFHIEGPPRRLADSDGPHRVLVRAAWEPPDRADASH